MNIIKTRSSVKLAYFVIYRWPFETLLLLPLISSGWHQHRPFRPQTGVFLHAQFTVGLLLVYFRFTRNTGRVRERYPIITRWISLRHWFVPGSQFDSLGILSTGKFNPGSGHCLHARFSVFPILCIAGLWAGLSFG